MTILCPSDPIVPRQRRKDSVVSRESYACNSQCVPFQTTEFLSRIHIPNGDGMVFAACSQHPAICRERPGARSLPPTISYVEPICGIGAKRLDDAPITYIVQPPPVSGERCRPYDRLRARPVAQDHQGVSVECVPHSARPVHRACDEAPPVGRVCDGANGSLVTLHSQTAFAVHASQTCAAPVTSAVTHRSLSGENRIPVTTPVRSSISARSCRGSAPQSFTPVKPDPPMTVAKSPPSGDQAMRSCVRLVPRLASWLFEVTSQRTMYASHADETSFVPSGENAR